ncbi:hypothetical protein ACFLRU_06320 [Bacteroidota bacterium]
MDEKLSGWLEKSVAILRNRIANNDKNSLKFLEEINLRRGLAVECDNLLPEVKPEDIIGHYQIVGANEDHSIVGYVGILSIDFYDNKFQVTWTLEGGDLQTGFGLLFNNTLSINFQYKVDGKEFIGLVSYEFLSENIMYANWIEEGSDTIGVEFGRKLPVEKNIEPLQYFGIN